MTTMLSRAVAAVAVAALALLAVPAVAAADVHRYQAVDSVEVAVFQFWLSEYFVVAITGTSDTGAALNSGYRAYSGNTSSNESGATPPSARVAEQCHRQMLLALSKPGKFSLVVSHQPSSSGVPSLLGCKLVRND